MADVVEQEIKVKLKAVLEGFDVLKKVKDDVKSIFSESNGGKLFDGTGNDAKALKSGINEVNKSIKELPANLAQANQESRGLVSTIRELFTVGGEIGQFISGIISLIKFFGITGTQVKEKLAGAFSFIKSGASEAFAGLKSLIGEAQGALTGLFSSAGGTASGAVGGFRAVIAGLGQSLTSLIPALASAGAGIVTIGVLAGAVVAVVAALAAAIAGVVAVAGGVALAGTLGSAGLLALASSGFEYLETLEKIELGTGALIAQLSDIKREGLELTGLEKVEAGIELGREQLAKLRVDAINTTATYEQLATAFQAAVGSGLGAGLDLDQIRQLTVGLAQAGAALGVPYDQLRQEINSILEGTIDINSRIAKNLGITNEEVKLYKQKGTLADELNKKLESFNIAGVKAAATLSGLKSNLQEALNVFSGEATTKSFEQLKERISKILSTVFDFKAGGLDKAFKPIAELIDKVLVQSINRFADWIETAVGFAKELGKFLNDNKGVIDDILTLVDSITRDVVGLIADMFGLTSDTRTWKNVLEIIRSVLKVVSGIVRVIRAEVQILANGFRLAANFVTGNLIPALDTLFSVSLPGLREMVGLLASISGLTSQKAGDSLFGGISDGLAKAFGVGTNDPQSADAKTGKLSYKGRKNTGATKKKGGGKDADKARQIAEAYDDLERTRIENAYNEFLANLRSEEAAIDESYKQRLISTDEFYAQKQRAAKGAIDAEINKEQILLALAEKKRARAKTTEENIQAQAELEAIQSRINVLGTDALAKFADIDRQKAEAIKELTAQFSELKNVLFEIEGLGFEAAFNRIDEKYKELIERASIDGNKDVVELINKIKAHEKTVARLTDNEKNYNVALAKRNDELEKIQELIESGALSEEQAGLRRIQIEREYKGELLDVIEAMIILANKAKDFDRIIALQAAKRKVEASGDFTTPQLLEQERQKFDRLKASLAVNNRAVDNQVETGAITSELGDVRRLENERKLKAELQASVNLMRELALATASLDDDLAVESLALEIQNLGLQTDTLGKGIIDALRDGIGGFFDDLISSTQSLTQSFKSMVGSILASIARLAANELLRSLFSSGIFKSGGGLGFLSGLKFAEGGHIAGGGTGVSDSIPILASHGEYMIKAATVRKLGVGFLNQLNSGNIAGLFGRFAAGGAIGSSQPMTAGAGASGGGWQGNIYNVFDPSLLKDYLTTSTGQDSILNVIKRNPELIKQYLR
jgi:hypothetical protein